MEYITGTKDFRIPEPSVVTIGKFDGRHRGHQKLLRRMMEVGAEKGLKTAVFTFGMMPGNLTGRGIQTVITTNLERKDNLEKAGIDYLVEYPFTEETAHMAPEDFVRDILAARMNAKFIVIGTDCSFGYKGAGNSECLEAWKEKYGYGLIVVQKEREDSRDISSTYVREELDAGHIEKANELLGQPYALHGIVVHGNHIGGSVFGFPTANILPPLEKHLPAFGVYVSKSYVDGIYYGGVTNVGIKPTVGTKSPIGAETFLYGMNQDIYGKNIEVQLLAFIRQEKKFRGFEQLKAQIERDRGYALAYLKNLSDPQIMRLPI